MRVLVTGANGFIGKNLCLHLAQMPDITLHRFIRGDSFQLLAEQIALSDVVIHLAGVNRPLQDQDFQVDNVQLTSFICNEIKRLGRKIIVIFASSIQVGLDNLYAKTKYIAESLVSELEGYGHSINIYRLPGVFGKWSKPNYNSVVSTFCHNAINGLPLVISNPKKNITLVYIDDVVKSFISDIENNKRGLHQKSIKPVYETTISNLADLIHSFQSDSTLFKIDRVGKGFVGALYSTYISYIPVSKVDYELNYCNDKRGTFVEILKTSDCGQFSYFTSLPGASRGNHYHHSKSEKFLVVKGNALFRFRNILTGDRFDLEVDGNAKRVVQTIPGWAHEVKNIGQDELIAFIWANENYDPNRSDTYSYVVSNEKN